MQEILIVSLKDAFRAPVLAILLNEELRWRTQGEQFEVKSAGTQIDCAGKKVDPEALIGVRNLDIEFSGALEKHVSRSISGVEIGKYNHIICVHGSVGLMVRQHHMNRISHTSKLIVLGDAEIGESIQSPTPKNQHQYDVCIQNMLTVVKDLACLF